MTPTPEQHAIYSSIASGNSTIVNALAGTGKTTTICQAIPHVPTGHSILVLAFNKKIQQELELRLKDTGRDCDVKTLNGLGHVALGRSVGRLTLDKDKIYKISKEVGLRGDDLSDFMQLVRAARMAGIVPRGTLGKGLVPDEDDAWSDLCLDLDLDPIYIGPARKVLLQSNKASLTGTIDFDDQIYASTLLIGSYTKYDTVFVDEAQDLSRMNHVQLSRSTRTQLVAVGDPHQAIYAWRGADSSSMQSIRSLRPAWTECNLSLTFRCPRRVVERQRALVPRFTAGPDNLEGSVQRLANWAPAPRSAILCRNNAPLISVAFKLLRSQVPVNFLGRDIGAGLKRLYNKASNHGQKSLSDTLDWLSSEAEAHPEKADKYESLAAVLEASRGPEGFNELLATPKSNAITLATGHRAKGLEWSTVYHLEPQLIPSLHATTETELSQEANLKYVIETRTRDKLRFVRKEGLLL